MRDATSEATSEAALEVRRWREARQDGQTARSGSDLTKDKARADGFGMGSTPRD